MSALPARENSHDPVPTMVEVPGSRAEPDRRSRFSSLSLLALVLTAVYSVLFYRSIEKFWFHPNWTTDDALQQTYPFHEVFHPDIFAGDLITEVMKGYLAPLHYWISYGVTYLTADPIMTGHWVMLFQLVLTGGFLFAAVRRAAGWAPAFLAFAWFLHTRHVVQRLTGGLPRGWAAVIITAFFYFAIARNHLGVLLTILCGLLLNPPSAFVAAVAYGVVLTVQAMFGANKHVYRKKFVTYALFAPVLAVVAFTVVQRPPQVGQMVTLEEAKAMPEFQKGANGRPNGRFAFLPFREPWDEIKLFGFQSFVNRFYTPPAPIRTAMPWLVLGSLGAVVAIGAYRKRMVVPIEILAFGMSALGVYFASRIFAFKLYVPDRHIQFPFAFFFIAAFTIGAWRAFHRGPLQKESGSPNDDAWRKAWPGAAALAAIASLVYLGSQSGLQATANFNYSRDKKGKVFEWLRNNTPETAMIAGQPTQIDGVQLFAVRRGYATTETTHPFYTRYYDEMKRRIVISWRAHYAKDFDEFLALVEPEGITHFVFRRQDFTGEAMRNSTYYYPLDSFVRELSTARPPSEYMYRMLPNHVDIERYPFMPFRDPQSVVVDVAALKTYVESQKRL